MRGYTISQNGTYNLCCTVIDTCNKCDTTFCGTRTITCFSKCDWSKAGFYYSNKCGRVTFEMGSYIDTCIQYTTWRYRKSNGRLDTIAHDRVFTRTMDTGWYMFKTTFHNKCLNCDTFIYKEAYIGCDSNSNSIFSGIERNLIRIVPTPSNDKITIYLADNSSSEYLVYNIEGKIIESGKIQDSSSLDVSTWKNGIYVLRIEGLTKKIIIQH
jgi:hypothetical protein